jgi:hypothetical protein
MRTIDASRLLCPIFLAITARCACSVKEMNEGVTLNVMMLYVLVGQYIEQVHPYLCTPQALALYLFRGLVWPFRVHTFACSGFVIA